jgi:hypothetical protein
MSRYEIETRGRISAELGKREYKINLNEVIMDFWFQLKEHMNKKLKNSYSGLPTICRNY